MNPQLEPRLSSKAPDLRGLDLTGYSLARKNLQGADCRQAKLFDVHLGSTTLRNANLLGTDFGLTVSSCGLTNLRAVCMSPDATMLALANFNHQLYIWNLKKQPTLTEQPHAVSVLLALSYCGNFLAFLNPTDDLCLLDLPSRQANLMTDLVASSMLPRHIYMASLSAACACFTKCHDFFIWFHVSTLVLYELKKNHVVTTVYLGTSLVHSITPSQDGDMLLFEANTASFIVEDVAVTKSVKHLKCAHAVHGNACISPDWQLLALSGKGPNICILHMKTDEVITELLTGNIRVVSKVFASDNSLLACATTCGSVLIWTVSTGQLFQTRNLCQGLIHRLQFTLDDASILSVAPNGRLTEIRVASQDSFTERQCVLSHISAVCFSRDSRLLAVSEMNGRILVWSVTNGMQLAEYFDEQFIARLLDISFDNALLASANKTGTCLVRTLSNSQTEQEIVCAQALVTLSFSPDNSTVATLDSSGVLQLWRIASGERLEPSLSAPIFTCRYTCTGDLMCSCLMGNSLFAYAIASPESFVELHGPSGDIPNSILSTLDGQHVAYLTKAQILFVWDVVAGIKLLQSKCPVQALLLVSVSPNKKWVAIRADSTQIILFNVRTQKVVQTIQEIQRNINSLAFISNRVLCLVGTSYGAARIWEIPLRNYK